MEESLNLQHILIHILHLNSKINATLISLLRLRGMPPMLKNASATSRALHSQITWDSDAEASLVGSDSAGGGSKVGVHD